MLGWSWDAFGGISTGAAGVVMSEVLVVIIARHFYGISHEMYLKYVTTDKQKCENQGRG